MNMVLGTFQPNAVAAAVNHLNANGFSTGDLSIITRADGIPTFLEGNAQHAAGEGMAVGAAAGSAIGALGSLVASTIPGMQATMVSGVLGTAAGGAIGAYLGGLYTMRAETQTGLTLEDALSDGQVIVLARTTDAEAERAASLMVEAGGTHVETHEIPPGGEDQPAA